MEIFLRARGVNGVLPRASGPQGSRTSWRAVRAETTSFYLEKAEMGALDSLANPSSSRDKSIEEGRAHGHSRVSPHGHWAAQRR